MPVLSYHQHHQDDNCVLALPHDDNCDCLLIRLPSCIIEGCAVRPWTGHLDSWVFWYLLMGDKKLFNNDMVKMMITVAVWLKEAPLV